MNFKIASYSALFFSVISGIFSLVFYFGDWKRLLIASFFGLFLGLLAAPEFKPKEFRHGWLLQISSGVTAGILFGFFMHLTIGLVAICCIVGGFLGWLAPKWINHAPLP